MMSLEKKQPPLKVRIVVAVATAIILVQAAPTASAFSQSVHDATITQYPVSNSITQSLGTGLTGLVKSIGLYVSSTTTDPFLSGVSGYIAECPTNSITAGTLVCGDGSSNIHLFFAPIYPGTVPTLDSNILATSSSGFTTFLPTKYYFLQLNFSFNQYRIKGCNYDCYSAGSIISTTPGTSTPLYDLYFNFSDTILTSQTQYPFTSSIISMSPADKSSVSSTTPISFNLTGYVSPNDIGSIFGVTFEFNYVYNFAGFTSTQMPTCSSLPRGLFPRNSDSVSLQCLGSVSVAATTSGTFTYSTTSQNLGSGLYVLYGGIYSTVFGIKNPFSSINFSTSTQFVSGSTTYWTNIMNAGNPLNIANAINNYVGTSTLSSLSACNVTDIFSFNVLVCIYHLFVPTWSDIKTSWNSLYATLDTVFPWGYFTRFQTIISDPSTASLPQLSFTIPAGLPAGGSTLNLTPWGKLWGSTSYLGTATSSYIGGLTLRQVVEPRWNNLIDLFFALSLLALIVKLKGFN